MRVDHWIPINEYIFKHNGAEDMVKISNILDLVGKCIYVRPPHARYSSYYTLPKYYIIGIDKNNSTFTVYQIKETVVKQYRENTYENSEYTTFKFDLGLKKHIKVKMNAKNNWLKIGTNIIRIQDIKETDLKQTQEVCTYERMYD